MILCPIIKNNSEGIKCLDISTYIEDKYIETFKNSLIDVNYFNIKKNIIITLDKPCKIIAINYLCDIESGIITISNNKKELIEINTLKDDSFIMKRKKTMFTLINTNIKQESTIYIIKVKNILKIVNIKLML